MTSLSLAKPLKFKVMETSFNDTFAIVWTDRNAGMPYGATECFVRTEISDEVKDALFSMLETLGFDCLDCDPSEGDDGYTEFHGHRCSYWARAGIVG